MINDKHDNTSKRTKQNFQDRFEAYKRLDSDEAYMSFLRKTESMRSEISPAPKKRFILGKRTWYVAAGITVAALLSSILYTYVDKKSDEAILAQIHSGYEMATLTLDNGEEILLGESVNLAIDRQGLSGDVSEGELTVRPDNEAEDIVTQTLRVPRGAEYRLTLTDGTRIHLNSESYITFPNRFEGDERHVILSGEAFFEVAHTPDDKPFIVEVNGIRVKQYGTVFNINTHDKRGTTVTLVSGSIGVSRYASNESGEVMLRPEQQAVCKAERNSGGTARGLDIKLMSVDAGTVCGWHEGYFSFNEESLASIAQTLSRWYDVDISVSPQRSSLCFTGVLSRKSSIADILDAIAQVDDVRYHVNGKKIVID